MSWTDATSNFGQVMADSAEVARDVLRLKREGLSSREIAETLGIQEQRINRLFRQALAAYIAPDVVELRAQEAVKLDAMEESIAKKVAAGNLPACTLALKIMDRRARLFGLDVKEASPEKQEAKILDVRIWDSVKDDEQLALTEGTVLDSDSGGGELSTPDFGVVSASNQGVDE